MNVVIIGAGGQARVVYELLHHDQQVNIVAFVDKELHEKEENINGIPVRGGLSVLPNIIEKNRVKGAIIAIGDNQVRENYYEMIRKMGLEMVNAIHQTSYCASGVKLGSGLTIAMGALVSTGAKIGNNTIINTGTIIEHDNDIGDHVHIAPGCSLAGKVTVKQGTFIGIGTVV